MPGTSERQQRLPRRNARYVLFTLLGRVPYGTNVLCLLVAMTAAQTRLADTIDTFYGAADKASEGAMAAHAYKRAVDDLDTGLAREMVRPDMTIT